MTNPGGGSGTRRAVNSGLASPLRQQMITRTKTGARRKKVKRVNLPGPSRGAVLTKKGAERAVNRAGGRVVSRKGFKVITGMRGEK